MWGGSGRDNGGMGKRRVYREVGGEKGGNGEEKGVGGEESGEGVGAEKRVEREWEERREWRGSGRREESGEGVGGEKRVGRKYDCEEGGIGNEINKLFHITLFPTTVSANSKSPSLESLMPPPALIW